MPTIADLISVSRALSAVILDGTPAGEAGAGTSDAEFTDAGLRRAVARRLTAAIENSAGLPPETWTRVVEVEKLLGVAVIDRSVDAAVVPTIDTVLVPDARVCFTGTVLDPSGREVSKSELEDLVVSLELALGSQRVQDAVRGAYRRRTRHPIGQGKEGEAVRQAGLFCDRIPRVVRTCLIPHHTQHLSQ